MFIGSVTLLRPEHFATLRQITRKGILEINLFITFGGSFAYANGFRLNAKRFEFGGYLGRCNRATIVCFQPRPLKLNTHRLTYFSEKSVN